MDKLVNAYDAAASVSAPCPAKVAGVESVGAGTRGDGKWNYQN